MEDNKENPRTMSPEECNEKAVDFMNDMVRRLRAMPKELEDCTVELLVNFALGLVGLGVDDD